MISARFRFDCYEDGSKKDGIDVNLHTILVTIQADTYNDLVCTVFQSHRNEFEWYMFQKHKEKKLKFDYHIEGGEDKWEKMVITKRKKIG